MRSRFSPGSEQSTGPRGKRNWSPALRAVRAPPHPLRGALTGAVTSLALRKAPRHGSRSQALQKPGGRWAGCCVFSSRFRFLSPSPRSPVCSPHPLRSRLGLRGLSGNSSDRPELGEKPSQPRIAPFSFRSVPKEAGERPAGSGLPGTRPRAYQLKVGRDSWLLPGIKNKQTKRSTVINQAEDRSSKAHKTHRHPVLCGVCPRPPMQRSR